MQTDPTHCTERVIAVTFLNTSSLFSVTVFGKLPITHFIIFSLTGKQLKGADGRGQCRIMLITRGQQYVPGEQSPERSRHQETNKQCSLSSASNLTTSVYSLLYLIFITIDCCLQAKWLLWGTKAYFTLNKS